MDWIEVSASSADKARDEALSRLGVDEADAEIIVLGAEGGVLRRLMKHSVRIRARIKPVPVRTVRVGSGKTRKSATDVGKRSPAGKQKRQPSDNKRNSHSAKNVTNGSAPDGRSNRRDSSKLKSAKVPVRDSTVKDHTMDNANNNSSNSATNEERIRNHANSVNEFIMKLCELLDISSSVGTEVSVTDDGCRVNLTGDELGFLIGHGGVVVDALQEVAKASLYAQEGEIVGNIIVDVAGYRQKRAVALREFALKQAQRALDTGREIAIEHMSSPERKIIHEAVKELDGLSTRSEGVETKRVVIIFATDASGEDQPTGT
ncbi:MAG: hypothetical protein M1399_02315 [Actinobacteria bacterium]|nr:hypothetical protein [Actinomycetota bacterium]MCL5445940.1 hypothetical protein [Actinomycetota bacterium]